MSTLFCNLILSHFSMSTFFCVLILRHLRMSTCAYILIISITTGFFINYLSLNMFFYFNIVIICLFCVVLKISNGLFFLLVSNNSSFYRFIHCSNICIKLSRFLLDSSLFFSVIAAAYTSSSVVPTSAQDFPI